MFKRKRHSEATRALLAKKRVLHPKGKPVLASTVVSRGPGILGASLQKTMKYAEAISLDASQGSAITHFFRANSVFDPNAAAGGHQPMGYDQLTGLYNHFTVVKSKISVSFINTSGQRMIAAISTYANNSGFTDINDIVEQDGATFAFLGPDNAAGATKSQTTLTKSADLARFFNTSKKSMVGDSLYRGSNNNPTEQAYFGVSVAEPTGGFNPGIVNMYVILTYDVVWTEPKRNPGS